MTFKVFGHLSPGTEEKVELPAEPSTAEKLGDAMASLLVAARAVREGGPGDGEDVERATGSARRGRGSCTWWPSR